MRRARVAGHALPLIAIGLPLLAQARPPAHKWTGTWILDVRKSTFEPTLAPGAPPDFSLLRQRMSLTETRERLEIVADIATSGANGTHSDRGTNWLRLDGEPSPLGPGTLSFRPIAAATFDILSRMKVGDVDSAGRRRRKPNFEIGSCLQEGAIVSELRLAACYFVTHETHKSCA